MKLKTAVASLLAVASMSAFAADQTVNIELNKVNYFDAKVTDTDGLLSGGVDVITFTGLAAGTYNFTLSLSGLNGVTFSGLLTTLNGENATLGGFNSPVFSFLGLQATDTSPFVLELHGIGSSAVGAGYSGQLSVSAVPEPATYGMLLGGLGLMGFIARRKAKKA